MKTPTLVERAHDVLAGAFEKAQNSSVTNPPLQKVIDSVLGSNHKTYKYILFTAILAKAADESVNPLALQAGAALEGAYDARSICHKVIVPFEGKYVRGSLGGSNEPFLNKPARFTMLSKHNAVRSGGDRDLLFSLCDNLPELQSSAEAMQSLIYFIKKLISISERDPFHFEIDTARFNDDYAMVAQFLDSFLNHKERGEILTLAVTATLNEYFKNKEEYKVEPHNTNQSGSSSREVSDLDVYRNGEIFALFELKDKNFSVEDVEHAVGKAVKAGFYTLNFVYGRSIKFDSIEVEALRQELLTESFTLNVVAADPFLWSLLSIIPDVNFTRMVNGMIATINDCNFSNNSERIIQEVAAEFLR